MALTVLQSGSIQGTVRRRWLLIVRGHCSLMSLGPTICRLLVACLGLQRPALATFLLLHKFRRADDVALYTLDVLAVRC